MDNLLQNNEGRSEARTDTPSPVRQASTRECFEYSIGAYRKELGGLQSAIRGMMNHAMFDESPPLIDSDVKANIMLSVRHVEDARMRLGKVFEALGNPSPFTR